MSTQLLRASNKDDLFETEAAPSGALPPQVFQFEDVIDHIDEALVEKRVSHNQAYRFKVLESIFNFFESKRSQLLEAASQDFYWKAARTELELEYAFTLSQIAAALQSQCKPNTPGGALPDRFFSKLTNHPGDDIFICFELAAQAIPLSVVGVTFSSSSSMHHQHPIPRRVENITKSRQDRGIGHGPVSIQ